MLLEENILKVLKLIYNAENQSLHLDEIKRNANIVDIDFEYLISKMLEEEFIETEQDPHIFFLTHAGYEVVEEGVCTPEPKYNHAKYVAAQAVQNSKQASSAKDKRFKLIVITAFLAFVCIIAYLIATEKTIEPTIPIDYKVPIEIKDYVDSVENDLGGYY